MKPLTARLRQLVGSAAILGQILMDPGKAFLCFLKAINGKPF
jgi:hypothetical protein